MNSTTILTPDQRLRVFVSSTLTELVAERAAARRAIERLRLAPVMFELGARPYPPRSLYLAYLWQSHVFVGIYGESYGWTAPDMDVSGLEDELRHAGSLPQLLYVKTPASGREPRLDAMLNTIERTGAASYKAFSSSEELEALLGADLALLLAERFTAGAESTMPSTLPTPSSEFVGRRTELAELAELVAADDVRLVTLTGPGGIGKTRLAIEVAHAVADRFADGVVFVALAARGPEDFLEAIGAAIGLKDLGQRPLPELLAEHLRECRQLLVLDNCEQLLPSVGQVADLLEATRQLRVLVTSRAALRLTGEEEFPVPPLGVPRVTNRVDDVARADAVQLFCRRVGAVRHGYRLTERDAATVARICRRLDGLPLALELVAARASVLSIEEIAARLDRVLDLSARSPDIPERQRTLRQTMDWSYQQLPQAVRTVFAQLGVFVGPFSLPAAEAICRVEPSTELLDVLALLVDNSLLRPQADAGETRFTMLQIVREYARTRLDAPAYDQACGRHARYYRDIAVAAYTGLRGTTQRQTIAQLDLDADDIAAAQDWLLARGESADVAEMWWSLWAYHWLRGTLTEGRRGTSAALAAGPIPARQRARLLASDGFLAIWQRDYGAALSELTEALAIAERDGDDDVRMLVGILLLLAAGGLGDEAQARTYGEESLRLARAHHDRWAEAEALNGLCWLNSAFSRFEGNEPMFDDMLAAVRDVDDPLTLALALNSAAELRMWQGRSADAATMLAQSLAMLADVRMLNAGAACLHSVAFLLATCDDWSNAVSVQAAADTILEGMDAGLWPPWVPRRERLLTDARQRLGDAGYNEALATGRSWTFDDAVTAAGAALTRVPASRPVSAT